MAGDRFVTRDQHGRGEVQRFHARTHHEQLSSYPKAPDRRGHRRGARDGCEDHSRSAEPRQLRGGILGGAVEVLVSSEAECELLLLAAAGDRNSVEAELSRKLNAQMPEAADPEDRDEVSAAGAAVA